MAYIESIKLSNFRNYESLELSFDKGTNIFYGDNAQGKTNILESVYLCGTSKSHKGSKDREIIRFEQDEAHIRMMVGKDSMSYKIDMHLRKNKAKGVAINGLPIKKARASRCGESGFLFPGGSEYYQKRSGRATKIHGRGALSAG